MEMAQHFYRHNEELVTEACSGTLALDEKLRSHDNGCADCRGVVTINSNVAR